MYIFVRNGLLSVFTGWSYMFIDCVSLEGKGKIKEMVKSMDELAVLLGNTCNLLNKNMSQVIASISKR